MTSHLTNIDGFDQPTTYIGETTSQGTKTTFKIHGKAHPGLYMFHAEANPDVRFSAIKNNPMAGMTFVNMIRLLYIKRKSIDWSIYPHRILALLLISIVNSVLAMIEEVYVAILRVNGIMHLAEMDDQAPVFVLGHPRTGTTLLHSLLALDEDRFCVCSTFMAGFPTCFLFFERLGKRLFAGILSETRPMDNMRLHFDLPQEDELATYLLSGGRFSPYMSLYFMRDEQDYRQYQSFRNSSVTDIAVWRESFEKLLTKIKARDIIGQRSGSNRLRRLLLKSPCHTARARILLKMFPNAKFVYVHRNPFEVFLSGAHMASTTYGYMFLQKPTDEDLQEYILRQGEILIGEYLSCVDDGTLGKHNLVEVSFEDLTSRPEETMKLIYSKLGFRAFDEDQNSSHSSILRHEYESLRGYKRNVFDERRLSEELLTIIRKRWHKHFSRFGYETSFPPR